MSRVMIAGTFDNFHVGHQYLIAQALEQGSELVIIVARDETVERIKGKSPVNNEEIRLLTIRSWYTEECILIRHGRADADFHKTLEEESPDILLLGYDQYFDTSGVDIEVRRAEAYKPEVFKSSKFNL